MKLYFNFFFLFTILSFSIGHLVFGEEFKTGTEINDDVDSKKSYIPILSLKDILKEENLTAEQLYQKIFKKKKRLKKLEKEKKEAERKKRKETVRRRIDGLKLHPISKKSYKTMEANYKPRQIKTISFETLIERLALYEILLHYDEDIEEFLENHPKIERVIDAIDDYVDVNGDVIIFYIYRKTF